MKTIRTILHKRFLSLLVALFCMSCMDDQFQLNQEENGQPGQELDGTTTALALPSMPDMSQYRSMTSASIARNLDISSTYMLKFRYRLTTEYYYHNYERTIREEAMRLNSYFGFQNFDYKQFSHYEINFVKYTGTPTLPSQLSGSSGIYNAEQLRILDNYAYEMYNARSTSDTDLYYGYGQNMVRNSQLSSEQKYVVLAFIETSNEYAKKHFAGQWQGVRSDVGTTLNQSTSGCSINWKSVWQSAVIGFVGGAVSGAYVGATGGTVALPGFGTVTGGVAGAVFGGAAGFAGGAAGAIAQQVVFDCLFKSRTTQPDLQCNDIDYLLNHPDCMQEIIDNKVWAKITG